MREAGPLEQQLLGLPPMVDDLQNALLICPVTSPGPCTRMGQGTVRFCSTLAFALLVD